MTGKAIYVYKHERNTNSTLVIELKLILNFSASISLKALSHYDDLDSVCPMSLNTLAYVV